MFNVLGDGGEDCGDVSRVLDEHDGFGEELREVEFAHEARVEREDENSGRAQHHCLLNLQ